MSVRDVTFLLSLDRKDKKRWKWKQRMICAAGRWMGTTLITRQQRQFTDDWSCCLIKYPLSTFDFFSSGRKWMKSLVLYFQTEKRNQLLQVIDVRITQTSYRYSVILRGKSESDYEPQLTSISLLVFSSSRVTTAGCEFYSHLQTAPC